MATPTSPRYATGPYKLIETPIQAQNCSKPYPPYVHAASIMTLGHNVILRGLNSIILQAPYVPPSKTSAFIEYALIWAEVLTHHHTMEETRLFPEIERITGEKGIMDGEKPTSTTSQPSKLNPSPQPQPQQPHPPPSPAIPQDASHMLQQKPTISRKAVFPANADITQCARVVRR
ncbi:hypothetical protein G7Y89_g14514 [Cudoniella acicularis]|uniref:Hemerythrin-like domain-containing protein n=1 Tax=Cudoniella acicularis TaxID=354080 RepID=A0A8H4R1P4_9HELO|nr:hypothetical protein G7Y89_g14514 [Cudoniella acicularis]